MSDILKQLGLGPVNSGVYTDGWVEAPGGGDLVSINPATGEAIATVQMGSRDDYDRAVEAARHAFEIWRLMPAPKRGEVVRQIGNALRENKAALGALVTMETGKIRAEGEGEVQEMIDIADFAVGLSRQLYGLTIHSERPSHRMYEQWHPLGVVGVISAFNFPVAVWSWNALLAAVCGDSVVWKPSEETPLTAIATTRIVEPILREHGVPGLFPLVAGGREIGVAMAEDRRIPLVSATGSCAMGRSVGETVARRLGRSLLELGGNNAIIVLDDARLDLALRAVLFGAVGTAGQRCTSTRRVLLQKGIAGEFAAKLVSAYETVAIGDPLEEGTLMGPLVNERAVRSMTNAIALAKEQGGELLYGGNRLDRPGFFVEPAIIRANAGMGVTHEETFAPIVYLIEVDSLEEAIRIQNDVPQGLSSAIFTDSVRSSEHFLSALGSDCGIANVNLGTSGAEIGGAFGGEKETGGGRESGSDSWKAYMRRQTNTINYGSELPLAQGIRFGD